MATALHTSKPLSKTWLNRTFSLLYAAAVAALLLRHFHNLIHSPSSISVTLFLADFVFAFLWLTSQSFHWNPIERKAFPENLKQSVPESEYPPIDVLICTADPTKEPPVGVVNTALSVLAYEYPPEKLSVYVSDDGGSEMTMYAFMECGKFAKHWIPYCKKYGVVDRAPEVYFGGNFAWYPETDEIKSMYEDMKSRVEAVVQSGGDRVTEPEFQDAFSKWTPDFTRRHHPTVIQIMLDNNADKDVAGDVMPNLIYVSREKNKDRPHNFKAGALNVMARVSGVMTNGKLVLVLDCDMYSNDPETPHRALCYFMDPNADPKLGFVQFPQRFDSINKNDIYASKFKPETQILSLGMDGLLGAQFMGTGGFFKRHVISDDLSCSVGKDVLVSAHEVASCNYEDNTKWGSTVSEDGFFLYAFLFLGAYGKDFLDFVVFAGGSTARWWNHQRMWLMWGLSSYPFALIEWFLKCFGLSTFGFNVTSKVVDEEQNKLYEQGVVEFGVESVLFFPISVASVVNLCAFVKGVMDVFINGRLDEFFVQIFISGFVVVNSWPVYEGMVLRKDRGKMPLKITLASFATTMAVYFVSSLGFGS